MAELNKMRRNLASSIRDGISADTLRDFHLAIASGHDARLVPDERTHDGWRVTWPEKGEVEPDLKTRVASVQVLIQYGQGMPVRTIELDGELRTLSLQVGAGVDGEVIKGLSAGTKARILAELTSGMLQPGTDTSDATDAEYDDGGSDPEPVEEPAPEPDAGDGGVDPSDGDVSAT